MDQRTYPRPHLTVYPGGMSGETFTERFKRLTAGIPEPELLYILGIKDGALTKLQDGTTQSLKLEAGLRLADRLGVSPWLFTSAPERATQPTPPADENESVSLTLGEFRSLRTTIEELQKAVGSVIDDVADLKDAKTLRQKRAG
jgi:hypothetical protein